VIDRYVLPDMRVLLTDRARLERWMEVELAVLQAWSDLGRLPQQVVDAIHEYVPQVDSEFLSVVEAREAAVRHDVAAFVDVLAEALGEGGRWLHFGLTSSDVVDTALSLTLRSASELIMSEALSLFDALAEVARRHRNDAMVGRTHGVHAELITFGSKAALLALQVSRSAEAFASAAAEVAVGKLSGPMGNYSVVEPEVEERVCKALQLRPISANQVIPRDLHAQYLFALARMMAAVEAVGLQVRLGHQTEVGELREGFVSSQKGSSAMPHKRNPIQRSASAASPELYVE
jgi:adenylosuccinate lyase